MTHSNSNDFERSDAGHRVPSVRGRSLPVAPLRVASFRAVALRALGVAALSLCAAAPASAQFGAAFGFRHVSGEETDVANSNRRGYEGRVFWDGQFRGPYGWRADLAGVQMQYQREIGPDRRQVSESGVEFALHGRFIIRDGALAGSYATLGPVASARVSCGVLGGFVDCDAVPSYRTGFSATVGYRKSITERRNVLFELRLLTNTVAGVGRPVLAFALGLQGK